MIAIETYWQHFDVPASSYSTTRNAYHHIRKLHLS